MTFPSHPGSSHPELLTVPQTCQTLTSFLWFTHAIPSPWNSFAHDSPGNVYLPLKAPVKIISQGGPR